MPLTDNKNYPSYFCLININKIDPSSFLDLSAPSLGLGSCWNGYFNRAAMSWEPLQKALGFPEGITNYGTMMLGYPKYQYYRMPNRNIPRVTWTD
jgi:nitroreductase